MSLALVKRAFFGLPDSPTEGSPLLRSKWGRHRTPSADTTAESDVESLDPKGCSQAVNPRQRIDARIISDATIGLADGLTVPFALTAGLSALGSTKVVIFGGLAELVAGALSMGLGGYLGARSEEASYRETVKETQALIRSTNTPQIRHQIDQVFAPYHLPQPTLASLTTHLLSDSCSPDQLAGFLLTFHHRAREPDQNRALVSAITIALGYFFGGFVPLLPYFFVGTVYAGLRVSVVVMAVALFAFGYAKTCVVCGWWGGGRWARVQAGIRGGVQMVVIGGVAAAAAMGLVMGFNRLSEGPDTSFEGPQRLSSRTWSWNHESFPFSTDQKERWSDRV